MRLLLLGDEDDAAGVAVEAMDDAGAVVAVDAAELVEVEAQGVDQRAGPVALGRMNHHVGRLVDGREVFVLVEDLQRDVFGEGRRVGRLRLLDADVVAVADAIAGLGRLAVDLHAAGVDDALHDRTAVVGEHRGEILIEARSLTTIRRHFDEALVGTRGDRSVHRWI